MSNTMWACCFALMATIYLFRTVYMYVRDGDLPKWDAFLTVCTSSAFIVALTRCSDWFKIH